MLTQAVLKPEPVVAGHERAVVHLKAEYRRIDAGLHKKAHRQTLVALARPRALSGKIAQRIVERLGGDTGAALGMQAQCGGQDTIDALPGERRAHDDGRVLTALTMHTTAQVDDVGLRDIPLVEYEHGGAVRMRGLVAGRQIGLGDALCGVGHHDRHVSALG